MNPPRPLSFRTSLGLASLSIAIALGGTACHSGPPRGPGGGPQAIHIPAMEAAGQFFDNQISADVRFGRAQFPGTPRGGDSEKRSGGGARGGGGRGPGGEGPDGSDGPNGPSPLGARARTEQNPAVQLHLTLTNRSAQPIEIEVLEFNSLLGNFAVHPAKVSLAPSGTATLDPMTSRLGIPQGDLPLKVRLRAHGKTEEQTLTLKIVSGDSPGAK